MGEKALKDATGFKVSTSVISDILNVSARRVRQLVEEGVIDREKNGTFELVPTIKKYILSLKLKNDGKADEKTLEDELNFEKIRTERAKADIAEINLARLKGTMHDATDVERVMNDMLSSLRAKLLSMPSKISPQLVSIDEVTVIQELIRKNIYESLEELSDYKTEMFYGNDYVEMDSGGDVSETTQN